jgi:serine/threonine kinase 16
LFPYFEKGTLWDVIQIARNSSSPLWPLNQRVALHLFHGICAGVLALHRAGYCHRDLKPHNIMLSSTTAHGEDFFAYVPIVTDFGSCAPLRVEVRNRKMSLDIQDEANRKSSAPYRAPELFEPEVEGVVDGQSDVWSLGCIL